MPKYTPQKRAQIEGMLVRFGFGVQFYNWTKNDKDYFETAWTHRVRVKKRDFKLYYQFLKDLVEQTEEQVFAELNLPNRQELLTTLAQELNPVREELEREDQLRLELKKTKQVLESEKLNNRNLQMSLGTIEKTYEEKENELGQTIANLQEQASQKQQRILALEADKFDLLNQFTQTKQKLQTYLSQEKAFLHQEIKLIKEVLND